MHNYLQQLLELLSGAKTRRPRPRELHLPDDMKGLEDVIDLKMSMEEAEKTMEYIFGVERYYFPPAEKLNDEQLTLLVSAILDLWHEFHYEADLPVGLPARIVYPLLVDCWNRTFPLLRGTNGTWHVEFCHYEPAECPFPSEFCRCKEWS